MNEQDKQHFEDLIVKAIQSTKQENSGLIDTIMHKMEKGIEESINRNVNGKIKRIDEKLDAYIVSDNQWKDKYSPMLEAFTSISVSGKIILKLVVGVGSFVLAIAAIKDYFFK